MVGLSCCLDGGGEGWEAERFKATTADVEKLSGGESSWVVVEASQVGLKTTTHMLGVELSDQ